MSDLLEMMIAVKDYNIELCKGINTLTRDIAMLHLEAVEQVAFRKNCRPATKKDSCDYAEKGLTCAMPL